MIKYPVFLSFSVAYFIIFLKYLFFFRKKTDVFICQYHPYHLAPLTGVILSKLTGKKSVLRCDDIIFQPPSTANIFNKIFRYFINNLNIFALKHSDMNIVNSNELKIYLQNKYAINYDKIKIQYNGVVWDLYQLNKNIDDLKNELKIKNKNILIFVGSFYELRGLDFLIESLPNVIKQFPDVLLLLIGGEENMYTRNLKIKVKKLNLEKNVFFFGFLPHEEVIKFIHISDIAIGPLTYTPRTYGTSPKKIGEYMACSKPIISCIGGQSSFFIKNDYNGILIKLNDLNALERAIIFLLSNKDVSKNLGENGKKFAKKYLTYDKMKTDLNRWLKDLF